MLNDDEEQIRHRVGEKPSRMRTLGKCKDPMAENVGSKAPWWGHGCGWGTREKEERDLGRGWDNQERTASGPYGPYRPLGEGALSWGQSCRHDLGRGSDQIGLVFEEKPYSFLAFSLFSAFAGGRLGPVLEMLIKLSAQVGMAGGTLSGIDTGTVGFPFPALSQVAEICSQHL